MAKRLCVLAALLTIVCQSATLATGQNVQNVRRMLEAALQSVTAGQDSAVPDSEKVAHA